MRSAISWALTRSSRATSLRHVDITRLTAEGHGLVEATTDWVADVTDLLERINARLVEMGASDEQVERMGEMLGLTELVRVADRLTEEAQRMLAPHHGS